MRVKEALNKFTEFLAQVRKINKSQDLTIWGNDNTFDNIILENSYRLVNQVEPWKFWNGASVRTLVNLGLRLGVNPKKHIKREGIHHNALDDSLHQIKYCRAIMLHATGKQAYVNP